MKKRRSTLTHQVETTGSLKAAKCEIEAIEG
jgi:hypothetical protein